MKRFLSIFILTLLPLSALARPRYAAPERFGAKGDGVTDDSQAISECIRAGYSLKLKKRKTYVIRTALPDIPVSEFGIKSRGGTIVIDKDYPAVQSPQVFRFSSKIVKQNLLYVKGVNFICRLGQKYDKNDKTGDTYIFTVPYCDDVRFEKVNFSCGGEYNNVSFIVSYGCNISVCKCDFRLNTHSAQGGLFWLMNLNRENCTISLTDSYFEHDAMDECMCFSNGGKTNFDESRITVNVKNCEFYSAGACPSSGFIIVYNNGDRAVLHYDGTYENCSFRSDGANHRKICSYQCGTAQPYRDYGTFESYYRNCSFDFQFTQSSEAGLLNLQACNTNLCDENKVGYEFENCSFNLGNVSTILGDKDGVRKGYYTLRGCTINTTERTVFKKKYNAGAGRISLTVEGCNRTENE